MTLTKEPKAFFLKKEQVQKTLKVANTLIASAVKSKGARRVSYLNELRSVIGNLAVNSYHASNTKTYVQQLENQLEKKDLKKHNTEELDRLQRRVDDLMKTNWDLQKELAAERKRSDAILKDLIDRDIRIKELRHSSKTPQKISP